MEFPFDFHINCINIESKAAEWFCNFNSPFRGVCIIGAERNDRGRESRERARKSCLAIGELLEVNIGLMDHMLEEEMALQCKFCNRLNINAVYVVHN